MKAPAYSVPKKVFEPYSTARKPQAGLPLPVAYDTFAQTFSYGIEVAK